MAQNCDKLHELTFYASFISALPRSQGSNKTKGIARPGSVDDLDMRCKTQKPPVNIIHITENPIPDNIAC